MKLKMELDDQEEKIQNERPPLGSITKGLLIFLLYNIWGNLGKFFSSFWASLLFQKKSGI